MSTTIAALHLSSSRSGRTARARSQNSAVAGQRISVAAGSSSSDGGESSGGSGNSCSPRSRSALRLVTRNVVDAHRSSSAYTTGAAAVTCSKVSSTINDSGPANRAARTSSSRAPDSTAPIALASSGATSAALRRSPSETKKVPPGYASRTARAASMARRVFPIPPVPVNVSSRTSGRPSVAVTCSSSRARPSSGVGTTGRGADASPDCGTWPRATASNARLCSPARPRAAASRCAVSPWTATRRPRSASLTVRALIPARSARPSCVNPAARRRRRSDAASPVASTEPFTPRDSQL